MKTPEEIKKGLSLHRSTLNCDNICPYDGWNTETGSCIQRLMKDTVEYIEHLESRLAQVERERDAAIDDLRHSFDPCTVCKKQDICAQYCPENDYNCPDCKDKHRCICHNCTADNDLWEWRGVREENTHDQPSM